MSEIIKNQEDEQATLTKINDEPDELDRRYGSIAAKHADLSTSANFRHIMNEDRSTTSGNSYNEKPTDAKNNTILINPDFDEAIKLGDQFTGSPNHDNDEVRSILHAQGTAGPVEEKRENCAHECMCKIKEALGLIVEEIKKVDAAINGLEAKSQCPYTPKPNDKKEFAKSVEKNSEVCHVIIDELKKQRIEINEMLELYEESSRDFSKLEITLKSQREKIEHTETILDSITNTVQNVKNDIANRHESYLLEVEARRTRIETREEILKVFLNWIMSLDAKRFDDREAIDSVVREAMEERNRDRGMLTLAIRQLQEVKRIEILLMTQNATPTQGAEDTPNVLITGAQQPSPAPFCKCVWPINRIAIISDQCNNARANCASIVKPGQFFNISSNRCVGGADLGTAKALGTVMENGNGVWYPRMPTRYHNNLHPPMIYQRCAPILRRKSPSNNPRRRRRNIRNVNVKVS